jgi:hypothetical protein
MYDVMNVTYALSYTRGRHQLVQMVLSEMLALVDVCRELATPLLTVKPVGVYSTTLVQYLYISCYLSDNKPVLSYLLSRLLPQW